MAAKVTLLSGGVGGSKLALGFSKILPPQQFTVIANTGDDFQFLGLHISPDCDTLIYTLAGLVDPVTGWGVSGDTFHALEVAGSLGAADWFRLGDRDLGLHLYRTSRLREGMPLSEITRRIAAVMGTNCSVIPMCDKPVPTRIDTDHGDLHLQEYLVRHGMRPVVNGIRYENIDQAEPAPGIAESLAGSDLIIAAPSNPFISVGPILAVPRMKQLIQEARGLKIGISPIVSGKALKGPLAKMLEQLGHRVSATTVARMWADWLEVFVVDESDAGLRTEIQDLGLRCVVLPTVMTSIEDKKMLAQQILDMAGSR